MPRSTQSLAVSKVQQEQIERWLAALGTPQQVALRCRIVLASMRRLGNLNFGTAQSVAEILRNHVLLELEGIDRMYLNVYVPVLQAVEGVLKFIRIHRGHPVASTAMVEPITRRFVESIERYVRDHNIPSAVRRKG